jgi:hypothetical protein
LSERRVIYMAKKKAAASGGGNASKIIVILIMIAAMLAVLYFFTLPALRPYFGRGDDSGMMGPNGMPMMNPGMDSGAVSPEDN